MNRYIWVIIMDIRTILFWAAFFVVVYVAAAILQRRKLKNAVIYDPCALWIMFSRYKCNECGAECDKPFERFEYAYQEIEYFCPDCKKITKCTILGSFHIHVKTPREKKFEKLVEKWYTDYEREGKW